MIKVQDRGVLSCAHSGDVEVSIEIKIGERKWALPVRPNLQLIKAETKPEIPSYQQAPIIYEVEPGIRLVIMQAQGSLSDEKAALSLGFWGCLQL